MTSTLSRRGILSMAGLSRRKSAALPWRAAVLLAAAVMLHASAWSQIGSTGDFSQLSPASPEEKDVYHLHGIVRDGHTGKPIARALVQAFGDRMATLTDHDGRFAMDLRFNTPPNGTSPLRRAMRTQQVMFLGLTARKPGYVNRAQAPQSIAMSAIENDIELKLTPEAVIHGRVSASGDDRPEGVRVSLFFRRIQNGVGVWNQMQAMPTSTRGEFRFGDLASGEYRIMTQEWSDQPQQPAAGDKPSLRYSPVSFPAGSGGSSGPSFHLGAGEDLQVSLNLYPEMYYPVHIPVMFPSGNPGLQVRVHRNGAPSGLLLSYNARERSANGMLPNGVYEVALESFGADVSAGFTTLTVDGAPVHAPPVTMLSVPSIRVILHKELLHEQMSPETVVRAGVPARNSRILPMQVMLMPEEPNRPTPVLTPGRSDPDNLMLERVLPGTYRLEAYAMQGYIASAASGGTDLLRQPLHVAPGASVAPIEIVVRDDVSKLQGSLAPEVLQSMQEPRNLYIACLPTDGTMQHLPETSVLPDGRFSLGNLPPGGYKIFASRHPLDTLEYRSEAFMRRNGSKAVAVTLSPGESADVTLTAVLDEEP